jgi:hypothetical protein
LQGWGKGLKGGYYGKDNVERIDNGFGGSAGRLR